MSYVVEPGADPQEQRRRRRLAEALLQQGMDTSPILSPWQGAARMGQALMGGWELGLEDKRDREALDFQNKGMERLEAISGGGAAPSATTAAIAGKPMGGPIKLGGFDSSLGRTLQFEGGVNPSDTNGTPSVNGINQKANPDVDLNRVQSDPAYRASIYRERYWNPIQADKMDPRLAHVAFDTSVIAGPGKAKELLAKSGGDPEAFLKLREDFQNRLLQANPEKFGKYAKAWANRNATLRADIGVNPGGMFAVGGGGQATMAGGSGDTLQPSAPAAPAGGMDATTQELVRLATDPRYGKAVNERAKMQLQFRQKETPSYGFTVTPDGTLLRTNLKTGSAEPVGNYAKPDPTTERKNYEADMADRKARGQPDVPYGEWLQNYRKAGAQNINLPNEKATTLSATKGVEAMDTAQTASRDATRRIATYGQMAEAMKSFTPGATAEMRLKAMAVLKDLGIIEGDQVPDAQAFDALSRRLELAAAPKGQGQITENERAIIRATIPTIRNDPAAIAKIIDSLRRLDEYDIKVAKVWRENARKNGGVPNYLDVMDEIDKLGPPMSEKEVAAFQKLQERAAGAATSSPSATPPPPAPTEVPKGFKILKVQ